MGDEASTVRLVRCPKCENLLPELPEYSVYQCGGCGALLRGKQQTTPMREKRPSEKPDNESGTTAPEKRENTGSKSCSHAPMGRESDGFDLDRTKGRTVHGKVPNSSVGSSSRSSKREGFEGSDQIRRRRLDFGVSNEFQETRRPIGSMGFHRNVSVFEKGRFGNEGPSSSRLWDHGGLNHPTTVHDLETDRAELLKKLDELRAQLSRSCTVAGTSDQGRNGLFSDRIAGTFRGYEDVYRPPPRQQHPPPTYHDRFLGYDQEPVFDMFAHQPFCSCAQCYGVNWHHAPRKIRPFSSFHARAPVVYGPPQPPRRLRVGYDSFGGGNRPRRRPMVVGQRVSRPVSNGAPFVSCRNCFEPLEIPRKLSSSGTMKCGGCSASISLRIDGNKIVASASSPRKQNVGETRNNVSNRSSLDYDQSGYDFQAANLSGDEHSREGVAVDKSPPLPDMESNDLSDTQNDVSNESRRTDQEEAAADESVEGRKSSKDATEMDVTLTEYLNCDAAEAGKGDDCAKNKGGNESFFAGLIRKRLKDFSRSGNGAVKGRSEVVVNGHRLTDRAVKRAEKLAGRIQPGEYWYDHLAGFWGAMNQPCLGIIPPFIEEFDFPMPEKCAAGNTSVFVNRRELNQKDLDLLAGRGLPTTKDKSYVIDISGKVVDEDTSKELDSLGRLAPTVERVKHGFGMKVPQAGSK